MAKVTLVQVHSYEVFNEGGQSLGLFNETGNWKNFVELSQGNESIIVIAGEVCGLFSLLRPDPNKRECAVVLASPDILVKITQAKTVTQPESSS